MEIELVSASEIARPQYLALRKALWPAEGEEDLSLEIRQLLSDPDQFAVIARQNELVIGFAEASKKTEAPGCKSNKIAFLNGWYVVGSFRNKGIGRQLLGAVEKWGKENKLLELASDTTADYPDSPPAHSKCGFVQSEELMHYFKVL